MDPGLQPPREGSVGALTPARGPRPQERSKSHVQRLSREGATCDLTGFAFEILGLKWRQIKKQNFQIFNNLLPDHVKTLDYRQSKYVHKIFTERRPNALFTCKSLINAEF